VVAQGDRAMLQNVIVQDCVGGAPLIGLLVGWSLTALSAPQ